MPTRNAHRLRTPAMDVIVLALATVLGAAGCAGDTEGDADTDVGEVEAASTQTQDTTPIAVAEAGLATPESILHDATADVYLVSNINGAPLDKDGNGFIARVAPDGTVEQLRWIDGEADGTTLHAPKGLALHGDTLFVADIDTVRAFHRTTGESLGALGVPGATFLNDVAIGPDGSLYVTDSGLNPDFSSSGTAAVYRFDGGEPVRIADPSTVGAPNGIVVAGDRLIVASFAGPTVQALAVAGDADPEVVAELPGGQLDGIVRLDDGSYLVSSWETETVYRIPPSGVEGAPTVVVDGVPSPADIGWDALRSRVLIPVFTENRLLFEPLPAM